jgi:hypothetical protein
MIDKEREKISKPLDQIDPKDLVKKSMMEYFVSDPNLINEYRLLNEPVKKRYKYTVLYDVVWFFGVFLYCKNITYYSERYFPVKKKGFSNMFLISIVHCFMFVSSFVVGNLVILGVNPYTFYQKHRNLSERMISSDPYKDITPTEFFIKYTEIEEIEKKKDELRKLLEESIKSEKNDKI